MWGLLRRATDKTGLVQRTVGFGGIRGLASAAAPEVDVHNEKGEKRVVVTKPLPGTRWLDILTKTGNCRVEVCKPTERILSNEEIKALIGTKCDGAIGQLTEPWDDGLFDALSNAGGKAFSTYAVGYDNVRLGEATKRGIAVGNTPGVLTETTAELAAALTLSAARRVVEADTYMRAGKFQGWLPTLFVGNLLQGKTLGIIGAGRIGSAYAKMMVEGHKMDLVYYDMYANKDLEGYMESYSKFLQSQGHSGVSCRRAQSMQEVCEQADVLSLHCKLDDTTKHLLDANMLRRMKGDAILVNTSRGPVIDEQALVNHLNENPSFKAALDVFEREPEMAPGLEKCQNAVIVPHIASASEYTRAGPLFLTMN